MFGNLYSGQTVLITGHTGFKGSWLSFWLTKLGANVVGYSLAPPQNPNHFDLLGLDIHSYIGDIRDAASLDNVFLKHKPSIVFHLAAQPLVRYSYQHPVETYETNVMGTLNVFEASRNNGVQVIINITSDKAYQNKEWVWGYRENDRMGGYDPYSSSKGCCELLVSSYRNSFFNLDDIGNTHNTLLASCRAGNVIGGGDWALDRLMTDIMVSVHNDRKVIVRSPYATRPWQHVLEPLSGYLLLGQRLLGGGHHLSGGWNFGPNDDGDITVEEVVLHVKKHWDRIDYEIDRNSQNPHEAGLLKLDCTKAKSKLRWEAVWDSRTTFKKTVLWYKKYYEEGCISTGNDLDDYIKSAHEKGVIWVS